MKIIDRDNLWLTAYFTRLTGDHNYVSISYSTKNTMIPVKFSCIDCCLKDIVVEVPIREMFQTQCNWFRRNVMPMVNLKHDLLSPHCKTAQLEDECREGHTGIEVSIPVG